MEMMEGVSTSIEDVRNKLRKIISPNTILVGHSLDCDLRALHIIHKKVIDTAALYPHNRGAPYKQSLKRLALDHLCKVVQADSGSTGHDSVQGGDLFFLLRYHVLSYYELSCSFMSCPALPYPIVPCHVMSCVMSCYAMPCLALRMP